ncbi:MAG: xanthine dehydrogenase family protein [Planctomycetes bacterium]|nr:xanthine dehydrogenase family protein [Planctomycetota bacterium]
MPQVGTSPPRVDGLAKVTGAALYVDDIQPPGVLFGRTVRSTVPYARLDAIELDPDFDWSQVTVVTAADLTGPNVIALIVDDQPALVPVGGTIRHVDEAVALVAAPSKPLAEEARKHVRLVTSPLEPVFSIEDALEAKVLLHGEDNVFKRFEINKGDIAVGFAEAEIVIEGTYRTGAQEQMYIEPQGVIASWEGETVRLIGSIQCPYYVHKALKALYVLADEQVIVTQAVTGGGFGGKEEYPSMISAHATLLARKAGQTVKLVYERDEDVAATTKRHPSRTIHRLGFMKDGTLLAAEVDVVIDAGAYATLSEVVLSRAVLHAGGPYKIPHVKIVGRAVATNHPPHGAFRGFGAPQTTFAYERQIAKAAQAVGQDPFVFRRHNMYHLGDVTATGQVLRESVATEEVLDAVEAALAKEGPNPRAEGDSLKRGRGVAFYNHGAGFTGSGEERLKGQATLALLDDGRFCVRSSSTDIGQGAQTTFGQIAAAAAGISPDQIVVAQPSTDNVPDSGPTVASRTCMVVGHVVGQAAAQLMEQVQAYAKANDLDPSDRVAVAAHSPSELQATVTYRPPPGIVWDDQTYSGDAYPVFGWACCVVDVAVDTDTLEVTIERCVHAVDVGKAINPRIVQGQIEGGTLQALGWALWESVLYENGRVLNQRMTNSIIPTSIEAPELEAILVEVPYSHGPHGAKGVGEIPMDGPAAAVANAIEQALGIATDELPLLPETLDRLTRGGGK